MLDKQSSPRKSVGSPSKASLSSLFRNNNNRSSSSSSSNNNNNGDVIFATANITTTTTMTNKTKNNNGHQHSDDDSATHEMEKAFDSSMDDEDDVESDLLGADNAVVSKDALKKTVAGIPGMDDSFSMLDRASFRATLNNIADSSPSPSSGRSKGFSSSRSVDSGAESDVTEQHSNTSYRTSSTSSSSSSSNKKGVSFADNVPRTASLSSAVPERTVPDSMEDLIHELDRLQEDLTQAKQDAVAEKAMRKKKEKNMVKLAKQLNLRVTENEEKEKEIERLLGIQATLETKLNASAAVLEELRAKHEKDARDHHAEITDSQTKLRAMVGDYDAKIAELQKSHAKQNEELRRQILTTTLETDRLRMQLAKLDMAENPDKMEQVVERTLRSSMQGSMHQNKNREKIVKYLVHFLLYAPLVLLPVLIGYGYQNNYFSMDAMCMPCAPGTLLNHTDASFEAPWWVSPPALKPVVFSTVCKWSGRPRTALSWTSNSGSRLFVGHLVVSSLDNDNNNSPTDLLLDKRAMSVTVDPHEIIGTNARGREDVMSPPWSGSSTTP